MRSRILIAAFAAIVVLAAAFALWRFAPPATSAEGDSGPFVLVEAGDRELDGSPALGLVFSLPLDPKKDYDKHIEVFEMPRREGESAATPAEEDIYGEEPAPSSPGGRVSTEDKDTDFTGGTRVKGAWTVADNPRILLFPHIKPNTRYVLRVMPGLPGRGDQTLGAEARYSVFTAPVAPAYYFASRGMVLPARQNGGLPVVTVNVPEVDVQFLKVKTEQLPAFLDRVTAGKPWRGGTEASDDGEEDYYGQPRALRGAVDNWELDQLHSMTDSVYTGRFFTEQKANRRSVTFLPVEDVTALKEPGVYVAVMSQPNRFRYDYQVTYFYVSDLGLHARLFDTSADAYVSSLTDGEAVSGVEVSWLDHQGKILAQARTDGDGRAHFAERPRNARVVVARKGDQLSLIALKEPALDLSEYPISGAPYRPVRLFAYSGRDLYRPGETFELSVMARDADGRAVPAQPIHARLKRPDGKTQLDMAWQPDARFPGFYRQRLDLPADAPTGTWTVELRNDPADRIPAGSYRFNVEEFLPERMKLDLAAPAGALSDGGTLDIEVSGNYLYGAPAAGNRLLGLVNFERNRNPLAQQLPGFEFGDSGEDHLRIRHELEEQNLDEQGKARVQVDVGSLAVRHSPFTVRATLSLLETGGRPVIRSIERVHWPAALLVGVRPLFVGAYARENAAAEFEVVRADSTGKLHGAPVLPVRLFREDRNYYWRFDDQRGWNTGFTETDELVHTTSVDVPPGGRGKLAVPVKYGRYRLEILDADTGETLRYRFYAGWSAREDETQGVRPDRVALKLDKPGYREGDSAVLTVTPPHAGEALVTVEGDCTLWVRRQHVKAEGGEIRIPVDKSWQRHDLYVTVAVLRPGEEGERVTPARALGIIPLPLARDERKLAVSLEAPQKMEPERPLTVKVKVPEAKGQQAVLTLSAVDAGILNITRFATPDPYAFFFGQQRYGADIYDVYGRLIEKMAGHKGRLKFGGDSTPKPTRSLPKKVRLVDLYSGPVALDDQGEAEVSLPVPDFNGSLRLMAVVATAERFGSKEAEVTVAAPLVAELATPRFLTMGDTATIALDLQNLSGTEQSLQVRVTSPDGLKIGEGERQLSLKNQQKTTLRFPVEAGSAAGLAAVRVAVTGGQLAINREFALQVQAPTPQQQVARRYTVEPGDTLEIRDAELAGFLRPTVAAHLSMSRRPPIDVRSAIQGLLTYPYGCAEQTTSTTYPHLFIDEDGARSFGLKPYTWEQRSAMVAKSIGRLAAMQAPNGGFSLWGNVSEYEYWLSSYVANFLLDAREQGFAVPEEMHRKAMDFLLKGLQDGVAGLPSGPVAHNENSVWNDRAYAGSGRFAVLAYGGYVLARQARAPLSPLRQLHEARAQSHSGLALVQLGLALRLMGDEARGDATIAEGLAKPRDNRYWWGDYGSSLRDAALSYALLDRHRVQAPGKDNLIPQIAAELAGDRHYYSTQEKFALFLAGRSFAANPAGSWKAGLSHGGREESLAADGDLVKAVDADELAAGIRLHNSGSDKLFVELAISGNPARLPPARNDVIALSRDYFNADGSPLGTRPLRVGESIIVRVHASARARILNGLVVDHIPAGLEIENLNIAQGERMGSVTVAGLDPAVAMADPRIRHVEYRDDRFVAAVRLDRPVNLFYRARVVTPGRFLVPPVYAEDMYQPSVFGLTAGGQHLEVVNERNAAP